MNRSIRTLCSALIVALTPALAMADMVIQARSDVPASVIMDGTVLGNAPLDITRVHRGDHEIRFHALGTGLEQAFNVSVPNHAHGVTPVAAAFGAVVPRAVTVVEPAPVIVERPVVYARPAPAVFVTPVVIGRPYYHHRHHGCYRW